MGYRREQTTGYTGYVNFEEPALTTSTQTLKPIVSSSALPAKANLRKTYPIATGFVDYFPDAIAAVAHVSYVGNEQHNPGTPLHWDRSKSSDEADALMRHFVERGKIDSDGVRHSAKLAWRALALLQKEIEAEQAKGEGQQSSY
jgi:hypothetical protein